MLDEIIAPLFTTEWGRRTGWGVMISMLVLLIITFITTLFAWHSDVVITQDHKKINTTLPNDEVAKLIAQIPEQHIFGKIGSSNGRLPITSLQLRLVGVIKAVPEKFSRVIISEGGQPGKVYQVGDSLSGDVRINSIAPDGVVLDNGGRLEKLPLQRQPLLFQGKPKSLLPETKQEE